MEFDDLTSVNADKRIVNAELSTQVLSLKREGKTFYQIADAMGLEYNRVRRLYKNALADYVSIEADLVRAEELAKLDSLEDILSDQIRAGNLPAIDRLIRIMERRAKYLGLDKKEAEAPVDNSPKILEVGIWQPPDGADEAPGQAAVSGQDPSISTPGEGVDE